MSTDQKHVKSSRQSRIIGGYVLSCLTSAVTLAIVVVLLNEISLLRPKWRAGMLFGDVVALTMFIAPVILTATFLPATLFARWSEKRAEQRFIVHAAAGMAMAIGGSLILPLVTKGFTFQGIAGFAVFYLLAGLVAGATYWLIAGRQAGAASLSHKS